MGKEHAGNTMASMISYFSCWQGPHRYSFYYYASLPPYKLPLFLMYQVIHGSEKFKPFTVPYCSRGGGNPSPKFLTWLTSSCRIWPLPMSTGAPNAISSGPHSVLASGPLHMPQPPTLRSPLFIWVIPTLPSSFSLNVTCPEYIKYLITHSEVHYDFPGVTLIVLIK